MTIPRFNTHLDNAISAGLLAKGEDCGINYKGRSTYKEIAKYCETTANNIKTQINKFNIEPSKLQHGTHVEPLHGCIMTRPHYFCSHRFPTGSKGVERKYWINSKGCQDRLGPRTQPWTLTYDTNENNKEEEEEV